MIYPGFGSGFAGSLLNGGSIGDAFKAGVIGGVVGGIAGAYSGYRASRQGDALGTVAGFAAAGAQIGGAWGAVIGAIVGAIVAVVNKPKPPDLRIGADGLTRKPEHSFSTVFGDMQVASRSAVLSASS